MKRTSILSNESARDIVLKDIIEELDHSAIIVSSKMNPDVWKELRTVDIVFVDIMSQMIVGVEFIRMLKVELKNQQLIGLHIYQNLTLIQPLMDAGLDGYLPLDPPKSMVKQALDTVMSGAKFIPVFK